MSRADGIEFFSARVFAVAFFLQTFAMRMMKAMRRRFAYHVPQFFVASRKNDGAGFSGAATIALMQIGVSLFRTVFGHLSSD